MSGQQHLQVGEVHHPGGKDALNSFTCRVPNGCAAAEPWTSSDRQGSEPDTAVGGKVLWFFWSKRKAVGTPKNSARGSDVFASAKNHPKFKGLFSPKVPVNNLKTG